MRLTARTRLTLVCTAVLAVAGGTLVAVTYVLVSRSLSSADVASSAKTKLSPATANLITKCTRMKESGTPVAPDIARRLNELRAAPGLARELAADARGAAVRYSWEAMIERYRALYGELADGV